MSEKRSTAQYSLAKILGLWAAAALPMALLSWVIIPAVGPAFDADPKGAAVTRVALMGLGLLWEFALVLIMVFREEGDLRWATLRRRLWLNGPRDPESGEPRRKLWWWLVPLVVAVALVEMALGGMLEELWVSLFPFLRAPSGFDAGVALGMPEVQAQLVGAWGFLGLFAVFAALNTFLGEELLFRGVLLPKMAGVFGRWDWVANGLLFGFYHLSQPWGILDSCITGLFFAYPVRRFKSTWFAVILHSAQSVFFLFLILGIVLGLA